MPSPPRTDAPIITTFVYPPIPLRDYDWSAWRDGDEPPSMRVGWGRTEIAACADLLDQEDEYDG